MAGSLPFIGIGLGVGTSIWQQQQQSEMYQENAESALRIGAENAAAVLDVASFNSWALQEQSRFAANYSLSQSHYDFAVANNNALVSNNNAARAREMAHYESSRIRERNQRVRGAQIAAVSKAGVEVTGSAEDIAFDSAIQGELDALAVEYVGDIEAVDHEFRSRMFEFQGTTLLAMGMQKANMIRWSADTQASGLMLDSIKKANIYRMGAQATFQAGNNMSQSLNWQSLATALGGGFNMLNLAFGGTK